MLRYFIFWLFSGSVVNCHSVSSLQVDASRDGADQALENNDGDVKTTTATSSFVDPILDRLVEWIRSEGGFVSSNVDVRRSDLSDPHSGVGVFAKNDIEEGDLLFSIPRQCLITSETDEPEWFCDTTYNLVRELKLGNQSKYAPYVDYLLRTQSRGQLPSHWSEPGKKLLMEITGGGRYDDDQILPPDGPVGWVDFEWRDYCDGGNDRFEQHAFLMVIQRGWDSVLVPLYDLMSHRNGGHWHNTDSNSVNRDLNNDVQVKSNRFIKAGEELYTSYNECRDCGGRKNYGTPEILRDYGFVEMFPQTWTFKDQGVAFTLDQKDPHGKSDDLVLTWKGASPTDDTYRFWEEQIERLRELGKNKLASRNKEIPQKEWDTIVRYWNAILVAMEHAVSDDNNPENECSSEDSETCTVSPSRYDNLLVDTSEDFEYHQGSCDISIQQDFDDYADTEVVKSPYQLISYFEHPETLDTCFDLDNVYQICTSYRPHYHEMIVHYTARFLKDVKRILWVGGGDSMLLHEILKYPKLELVIGLELDQTVTRHSFKHFGTQPHWDNEKVQWWYGDAAKSLLMLPTEMFSSFDMVLVDLSETVMSNKVTKGLDIMGALSLLLKPDGIFVKNEMYFEKLRDIFTHTIQAHIYDFPVICSQGLSFGSNAVDFLHSDITDHGVETMVKELDNIDEHFSVVRDYSYNPAAQRHCADDDNNKEPSEQEASPGILMILEAEQTSADLEEHLESRVSSALESENLTIVSTSKTNTDAGSIATFVMQDGYIVARTWPEALYCAFDIHLWSNFDRLESLKKTLLMAAQSKSPSSFRIVAGGMFGVSSWKQDEMSRGPKFTDACDDATAAAAEVAPSELSPAYEEVIVPIMDELLRKSETEKGGGGSTAVVVCGLKSAPCPSLGISTYTSSISKVVPIWTCEHLGAGADHNDKFACEQEVLETLKRRVVKSVSVVVVDQVAGMEMAQIALKLLSLRKYRRYIFEKDLLIAAPSTKQGETWRSNFVYRMRDMLPTEPVFVSKVVVNSPDSSGGALELNLFSNGDSRFIETLVEKLARFERQTGFALQFHNISGGVMTYQEDFVPTQFFKPSDYNQTGPYQQWMSQTPRGHQTVFQLEVAKEEKKKDASSQQRLLLSAEKVKEMLVSALAKLDIQTASEPVEFNDLGDGSVMIATWSLGSVVVLFNGRDHVDVNLFTYKESVSFAHSFSMAFTGRDDVPLEIILRDSLPRGHGRVVNFAADLGEARKTPTWSLGYTTSS